MARRRVCHDRGRNYIITRARGGGGGRRRGASLSETRVTSQGEETTKLHLALGYTVEERMQSRRGRVPASARVLG